MVLRPSSSRFVKAIVAISGWNNETLVLQNILKERFSLVFKQWLFYSDRLFILTSFRKYFKDGIFNEWTKPMILMK